MGNTPISAVDGASSPRVGGSMISSGSPTCPHLLRNTPRVQQRRKRNNTPMRAVIEVDMPPINYTATALVHHTATPSTLPARAATQKRRVNDKVIGSSVVPLGDLYSKGIILPRIPRYGGQGSDSQLANSSDTHRNPIPTSVTQAWIASKTAHTFAQLRLLGQTLLN